MAKVTPIQESFAAGELGPKLLGRRSLEGYQSSVAEMTNMIADPRGPAISRSGFRFAQSFISHDIRLGLMSVSQDSNFLFVLTDLLLTVTGLLGTIPAINAVVNGDFQDQGDDWETFNLGGGSSVTFTIGSAVLDSGASIGGVAHIAQQLDLTAQQFNLHTVIVETDGATTYHIKIGDTENSTEYFDLLTSQARVEAVVDIPILNPWITIERVFDDGGAGDTITVNHVTVTNDAAQLEFVTPWPETELRNLYFVQAPNGLAVYILHPRFPPYKIEFVSGVLEFNLVVFTSQPPQWAGDSFPGSGTVFQGRLWLGGTPSDPQTFWGSKSGLLEDFTLGEEDDDAMEFTLSIFGAIVWMLGTKNLLIGTVNGEHVVSSTGSVITPTDISIEQQSAYGSAKVQPIQVGDQVFYVSLDGTKVRALQYEWSANNWLSKDLTFFSDHITKSGIREISWAPNPNNILLCTLNDGTMAWLSYERGENTWGWHKHVTDGRVVDTATGVAQGLSFTAMGVARVEDEIYVETLLEQSGVYMDSWVEKQDEQNTFTIVEGLGHLEGQTVQVVADNAVAPSAVVAGGQITLANPANLAVVGLQYTPKMVSLPIESGAPTGSSLAYLKRYNRLIVGLLDSALPLINGIRPPDRTPATPMNTREPNKTGQISTYSFGWSEGAIVTIEQDLPLALTVLYIGGELPQDVL